MTLTKRKKRAALLIIYECILITAALLSVLFIWTENSFIYYIDQYLWIIFLIDVLIRFTSAENKWTYFKRNPFDFVAAVPLDSIFQLARLARIIKLIRILSIAKHQIRPFFHILRTNGLDCVLTVSFLLIFGSAIIVKMGTRD
ncbi:ion transporter [Halobacillus sp. A5]|uniref:ion transporter n=1 Tax=Halobacillus sp. A5 TaxID=2880263 RepID=UPI0020A6C140|nr:ion transporter [Halobacillus sp. A5]MCP3026891.1 ion transporter [Halobacillus sp. A5]